MVVRILILMNVWLILDASLLVSNYKKLTLKIKIEKAM